MSDNNYKLVIEAVLDAKSAMAGIDALNNKTKKTQKQQADQTAAATKTLKSSVKDHKTVDKLSGPNTTKKQTDEMVKQNRALKEFNKLLRERTAILRSEVRMKDISIRKHQQTTIRGGMSAHLFPERRDGRNLQGRIGDMAGKGVVAGAGLITAGVVALLTAPLRAIANQYDTSNNYRTRMSSLSGLQKGARFGSGLTPDGFDSVAAKMAEYGYSPDETINNAKLFSRSTGNYNNTAFGMASAKTLGLETSEVSGAFGAMRSGKGEFGAAERSEFKKVLQAAVKGGVDASTLPDYLEGVAGFVKSAGTVSGGSVSSLPFAQLLALFGKSGEAGLQGERGVALGNKIDAAIKGPGGGEEGKAFILNTLGFGGPGGASYEEALEQMQLGLAGDDKGSLIKKIIDRADASYGAGSNIALSEMGFGSINQLKSLRKAFGSGDQSEIDTLLESMTATELDRLTSIDESMKILVSKAARSAKNEIEDIEIGDMYAEALEQMHDLLRQFIAEWADPISHMLTTVADGLTAIRGSLDEVASYFRGDDTVSNAERSIAMGRASDRITASANEQANDLTMLNASDPTSVDASARIATLTTTTIPQLLSNMAELETRLNTGSGVTDAESANLRSAEAADLSTLNRTLEALAANLAAQNRPVAGVDGPVDTTAEMIAILTAYGLSLPPSARAVIDRSGGSP